MSGWYGSDCMFHCQNCLGGCNGSGICYQCTSGRYGPYCQRPCPAYCGDNGYGKVYCGREDGECQEGCHKGRWGDTCYRPCNQHCGDRGCLQLNGHCIGDCQIGWWGLKCDRKCPHACKGGCGSMNAKCLDGCKDGFTSMFCNETCPDSCMECHQLSGKCVKCSDMLYGIDCDKECGSNCVSYLCNMQGRCIDGCYEGFTGPTCNEVCPVNCLTCKQDDVICTKCKFGWVGKECFSRREHVEMNINEADTGIEADTDSHQQNAETGEASKQSVTLATSFWTICVTRILHWTMER